MRKQLIRGDWMVRRLLLSILALGCLAPAPHAQQVSSVLLEALERMRAGTASVAQEALLFQNNNVINEARLNGWITDAHYQAAQNSYSIRSEQFAGGAAKEAGGAFRVQTRTSQVFQPGTDSDYIVEVKGKNPVQRIKNMQAGYNARVNTWLKTSLSKQGMVFTPRSNWHNRLDVDFMADPAHVTKAEFEAVYKINNGAYKRMEAAEYERVSRMKNGPGVSATQFREYALEMQEQIAKKQSKIAKLKASPGYLSNPSARAELHLLMAQEQKYITRIEDMGTRLRKQEGLPMPKDWRSPELVVTKRNGVYVFEQRSTIANSGAVRSPTNFLRTGAASAVTNNSVNRAVRDLVSAMSEAAAKNPTKWSTIPKEIASITQGMSPAEKGALLEEIIRRQKLGGKAMAKNVALEMRKAVPTNGVSAVDNALRRAFGVSNGMSQMGDARRLVNSAANKALGALGGASKVLTGLELIRAGYSATVYSRNIMRATDPSISDAEANAAFERAEAAANEVALSGAMGAIFGKVPTLGAMYLGWKVGYDGSRWLLENTKTGQMIDRTMTDFFDEVILAGEMTYDQVLVAESGQREDILQSYLDAIKEGRMRLRPGKTVMDLSQALISNNKTLIDSIVEPVGPAGRADNRGYMAWSNSVGWVHVGTVVQFRAVQEKRSELWGGLSKEPLEKKEMLGGKTFDTLEDAMKAAADQWGAALKRRFNPTGSPRVHYTSGEFRIGFEMTGHALFKKHVEAADKRG